MSNSNLSSMKKQRAPRLGFDAYGIGWGRYLELRTGCATGKYSPEILHAACAEFRFIEPWLILSVTGRRSYDRMEFNAQFGRICVGRTDFYGYRRKFYHNLNEILKERGEA